MGVLLVGCLLRLGLGRWLLGIRIGFEIGVGRLLIVVWMCEVGGVRIGLGLRRLGLRLLLVCLG